MQCHKRQGGPAKHYFIWQQSMPLPGLIYADSLAEPSCAMLSRTLTLCSADHLHVAGMAMHAGAVVLSNGDARNAANHTNNSNGSSIRQYATAAGADADLTALSTAMGYSQSLWDINILSFDVTPTIGGMIVFSYVFGSEEYEEFSPSATVNSTKYNDIFGFFIKAGGSNTSVNIAKLPNSTDAVGIGSVNPRANAYYLSNVRTRTQSPVYAYNTEYDGLTKLLTTVPYNVVAGTVYRLKLVISDGLTLVDSAVWIQAGSLAFKVDCVASWIPWSACSAACGGGLQVSTYVITTLASGAGMPCDTVVNGTVANRTCNTQACPVNCVGSWITTVACNATCGGGSSLQRFTVTTPAAHGGAACAFANGTTNNTACNTHACPVNCTGAWSSWGACSTSCGNGTQTSTFSVTSPAVGAGSCEATHGEIRSRACVTGSCPPSPSPAPTPPSTSPSRPPLLQAHPKAQPCESCSITCAGG
ncbi:hypothetical protein COO60DRAFT_1691714 [Scenedesmus sp. NREL 46B-D3]|nr:hypothetical protein COO60DRAFT_1691714 [Scenedesmus sp. NREL 46B-D3]